MQPAPLKSSLIIALAYGVTFAVAYAIMLVISRKSAVRSAVMQSRAFWEEEQRQTNLRLFGTEDI